VIAESGGAGAQEERDCEQGHRSEQVVVNSEHHSPALEAWSAPVHITAASHPDIIVAASEELERERGRRRDLSVGSVISTADSIKGWNLHGC